MAEQQEKGLTVIATAVISPDGSFQSSVVVDGKPVDAKIALVAVGDVSFRQHTPLETLQEARQLRSGLVDLGEGLLGIILGETYVRAVAEAGQERDTLIEIRLDEREEEIMKRVETVVKDQIEARIEAALDATETVTAPDEGYAVRPDEPFAEFSYDDNCPDCRHQRSLDEAIADAANEGKSFAPIMGGRFA